jgi:hypothetical protein
LRASEQAVTNLASIVATQKEALEAFRSEAVESREASEQARSDLAAA